MELASLSGMMTTSAAIAEAALAAGEAAAA
jgi:hypothetical protein